MAQSQMTDIGLMPIKIEGQKVLLIDQRKLPAELSYFDATSFTDMCFAIKDMVVRGAPSIGVSAAYGLAFEAERLAAPYANGAGAFDKADFLAGLEGAAQILKETRPTAVNLRWGVDRIAETIRTALIDGEIAQAVSLGRRDADRILDEHVSFNRAIGDYGNQLIGQNFGIITHCNAGSLAVCGWGTALGVIRSAHFAGKAPHVFVDETRPRNQGASLTMYELTEDKIDCTLICDNMSGHTMRHKKVDCVIVGADRIAANGDTANKIGTYNLAVLANFHKIPFYVAAPLSTFDYATVDGSQIPIEERDQKEVLHVAGVSHTVAGARAYNPAFDVTPAGLITAIITEAGILRPPYNQSIETASKTALKF